MQPKAASGASPRRIVLIEPAGDRFNVRLSGGSELGNAPTRGLAISMAVRAYGNDVMIFERPC